MTLRLLGYIELPAHETEGGFDHAAVHQGSSRLYVAHPCNDDVDVVDLASDRFLRSIHGLKGVAGVLVSEAPGFLFTANRGENTISIFGGAREEEIDRLSSEIRPNRLAFDPARKLLLLATGGDRDLETVSTLFTIHRGQKAGPETPVLSS